MPELCRFKGIVIQMYFKDIKRHHKPHIHTRYGKYNAVFALDGELLEGKIPPKQLKQVTAWITLREDELYTAWTKAVQEKLPDKIAP